MTAPQKSETPAGGPGIAEESIGNGRIVAPTDSNSKAVTTLKAQLAIAGHAVHELAGGGYLVVATKWAGICRECPDVSALAAFARQIGARA